MAGVGGIKYFLAVVCILNNALHISGKPTTPNPPVWEFHFEYELFQKIYDQVQALLRINNRMLFAPKQCPPSWQSILDSCYFLPLHWKSTWIKAEETCERLGGYLAILNSEEEDTLVSAYLKEMADTVLLDTPVYIWIGGFDFSKTGDWRWVNGEQFNYTNWRVTQHDLLGDGRENCLDWSEGWNDNECDKKIHFLCEREKM